MFVPIYIISPILEKGAVMATSSITKNFYVVDHEAFERLKQEIEKKPAHEQPTGMSTYKKSLKKLDALFTKEAGSC